MALNNLELLRYARDAIRKNVSKEEDLADRAIEKAACEIATVENASQEDQLNRFRTMIASVDTMLEENLHQLMHMGIPEGIARYRLLRDPRVLEQARVLRIVNGNWEPPLAQPDQSLQYIEYVTSGLPDNYAPTQPKVKDATQLKPHMQTIDGVTYTLYGDPVAEGERLIRMQGESRYAMRGTCGLCSTGNVLTMAGAEQAGEEDIISLAMHASEKVLKTLDLFDADRDNRGATSAVGRMELLNTAGLPNTLLYVKVNREQTMREVAQLVREGRGVILSVDVARLWKSGKGGHAITLLAVTEDDSTFFYSDTGRGCIKAISAKELGKCLTGSPVNVTEGIIR